MAVVSKRSLCSLSASSDGWELKSESPVPVKRDQLSLILGKMKQVKI